MLRSMYSGVAGLKVHQTRMDVIGNNIANVNTTAYKYQTINFSDVMYQTSQAASGSTTTTGGVNAKQIGLGAINASISTAITQEGSTQTTNNAFDMAISGKSFFMVNDGSGTKYTRDGSFYIDGDGNLAMQSTGYYVQGWGVQEDPATGVRTINKNGGIGKLSVLTKEAQTYPPEATGAGMISGNIDKNDSDITSSAGKTVQYEFYDNRGYTYTATFKLKDIRTPAGTSPSGEQLYNIEPGKYTMELVDITDSAGKSIRTKNDGTQYTWAQLGVEFGSIGAYGSNPSNKVTLNYNTRTGTYSGYKDDADELDTTKPGYTTVKLKFDNATITNNINSTSDKELKEKLSAIKAMGLDTDNTTTGIYQIDLNLKNSSNTDTSGRATIKTSRGNEKNGYAGRRVGTISGVNVSQDGKITATYTNGQTRLLGQIAVAQFANASGLSKEGENLYAATLNSGDASVMDVSEDGGKINTGVLEMSNVDLSGEFTSMITAQRGFQANSRIITVSDTLLEELTNLTR